MSDMNDIQPATAWTEEEWDPIAIARKRRNEMKNQMSEEAKEEQRRYEEDLRKKEEERKKKEEMKRLEELKKEERKKAKKEKKAKEASKPQQEEKISLTYSKKELKKAEEIKREKQREKSLQQKKQQEEKKQTVVTEVKEENEVTEIEKPQSHNFSFIIKLIVSFILFIVIIRMFPIYRLIMKVNPQEVNRLTEIVNEIRKLFGQSIVEFSELKQEKAVQKLMYLQINFKHFSDLVRFYTSSVFSKLRSFLMSQ